MGYDNWDDDTEFEWTPDMLDADDEEPNPPPAKLRTLTDMERDGEAARAAIKALLEADPDTPTSVLQEEMRKHVLPMGCYRATDEEVAALRRADIAHTLRGEKDKKPEEEEEEGNFS